MLINLKDFSSFDQWCIPSFYVLNVNSLVSGIDETSSGTFPIEWRKLVTTSDTRHNANCLTNTLVGWLKFCEETCSIKPNLTGQLRYSSVLRLKLPFFFERYNIITIEYFFVTEHLLYTQPKSRQKLRVFSHCSRHEWKE